MSIKGFHFCIRMEDLGLEELELNCLFLSGSFHVWETGVSRKRQRKSVCQGRIQVSVKAVVLKLGPTMKSPKEIRINKQANHAKAN